MATRSVVLVEGFTDVIACHLAGVSNVIVLCGQAADEQPIASLIGTLGIERLSEITVVGDGDGAGHAIVRRVDRFAASATTSVAVCPDGEDPCSLRHSQGDAGLRSVLERRTPLG